MSDVPAYAALAGVPVDVLYGLISRRADPVAAATFQFAWQRDRALIEAIDGGLRDAVSPVSGIGAKPNIRAANGGRW